MRIPRPARPLVAVVSLALLPLLPATATADGEGTPPDVQHVTRWCENVPASYEPFTDLFRYRIVQEHIECLARGQLVQGGPEGRATNKYGPELVVRRGPMASFIARMLDAAERLDAGDRIRPLPSAQPRFSDVPPTDLHATAIDRLAAAGIVQGGVGGRPATTYSPELGVTRAQMATFINRAVAFAFGQDPAAAGAGAGHTADVDYYTDDADAAVHQLSINGITSRGISIGDGRDAYGPSMTITRYQMAAFLARTLADLYEDGRIRRMDAPGGAQVALVPDQGDESRRHPQGGTISGVVSSALEIRSVEARAAFTDPATLQDLDPDAPGLQFRLPVRQDAPLGFHDLTLVSTFADGSQDTDTIEILVTRP